MQVCRGGALIKSQGAASDLVHAIGLPRRKTLRKATANPETRGPARGRPETGMKTNTRNERWPRLHDRFQQGSKIDASRRATFLDHVWDSDSELRNEVEALPLCGQTPGRLKRAVDRAGAGPEDEKLSRFSSENYRPNPLSLQRPKSGRWVRLSQQRAKLTSLTDSSAGATVDSSSTGPNSGSLRRRVCNDHGGLGIH